MCNKIVELDWEKLSHPSYSPDIASSDYHLFQNLQHFSDRKEYPLCEALETDLFFSSKHADFYKSGVNILVEHWENVIHSDGRYIID